MRWGIMNIAIGLLAATWVVTALLMSAQPGALLAAYGFLAGFGIGTGGVMTDIAAVDNRRRRRARCDEWRCDRRDCRVGGVHVHVDGRRVDA